MKRTSLFSALIVAGLLFSGCSSNQSASSSSTEGPAPSLDRGKEVYLSTCVTCHGVDAKGVKGLGKDLTVSTFVKERNDQQMAEFIAKGRDTSDPLNTTKVAMPPRGGNPALTDSDLQSVSMYLHSLMK